jgi:hypothetical protein
MGLLSTLIRTIVSYISILLIIIISSPNLAAESEKFWIYFDNKNSADTIEISDKALQRRSMRGSLSGISTHDIAPDRLYIESLADLGLVVHNISRWLNAASVSGPGDVIQSLSKYNFVKKIAPVATFTGRRTESTELTPAMAKTLSPDFPTVLDYGPSYIQLHLCQIDSLHSLGFTGEGVLIGIMDTGFRIDHPSLRHIQNDGRLVATHDFINGDDDVQDSVDAQQDHGTAVWSAIGAFAEDTLIGAAYNAQFILAKTELYFDEVRAEEDNWIVAAEWMEPQGVDIISSSLGYFDWYDQSDLDGNTTAITVAADIAASLGIIVVNSAGNERFGSWGAITPPADGDSVLAIGGVISDGTLWSGSSPGPTADGRIKPDVCAMASGVLGANYYSGGYRTFNGTFMAAPIVAGGLALILEAHPDWEIGDIFYNLKRSAGNSAYPNNDLGWGVARFYNMYSGQTQTIAGNQMFIAPHPAVGSVTFRFDPPLMDDSEISILTVSGDRVIAIELRPSGDGITEKTWDAKNFSGEKIASGIYIAHLQGQSDCHTMKFAFVK